MFEELTEQWEKIQQLTLERAGLEQEYLLAIGTERRRLQSQHEGLLAFQASNPSPPRKIDFFCCDCKWLGDVCCRLDGNVTGHWQCPRFDRIKQRKIELVGGMGESQADVIVRLVDKLNELIARVNDG